MPRVSVGKLAKCCFWFMSRLQTPFLVVGDVDGHIHLLDVSLSQVAGSLHLGPHGTIFVGDISGCFALYNRRHGFIEKWSSGHREVVRALDCTGDQMVIGLANGICQVRHIENSVPSGASSIFYTAPKMVLGCAIRQRFDTTDLKIKETVTVGSQDGRIYHDQFPLEEVEECIHFDEELTCIALTADGEVLYAGSQSGVICMAEPLSSLKTAPDRVDYSWCQMDWNISCLACYSGL